MLQNENLLSIHVIDKHTFNPKTCHHHSTILCIILKENFNTFQIRIMRVE